jgi:DNA-binding MarR family transcriptional regulator
MRPRSAPFGLATSPERGIDCGTPSAEAIIVNVVNDLDVANRLRPILLKLNRELRRELRDLGVTGGQASLLHSIRTSPGIGVGKLAAQEGMSAAAMTRHVDRLERAGLVTRTRSGEDRRRVGLAVTPDGVRVLRAVRSRRTAWLAQRLKRLSPAELVTIESAVEPMTKLLEAA